MLQALVIFGFLVGLNTADDSSTITAACKYFHDITLHRVERANDELEALILKRVETELLVQVLRKDQIYCMVHKNISALRKIDGRHYMIHWVDSQCKYLDEIADDLLFLVDGREGERAFANLHDSLKIDDVRNDQVICIVSGGVVNSPQYPGRNFIIQYLSENGQSCVLSYDTYTPPCFANDVLENCPPTNLVYRTC